MATKEKTIPISRSEIELLGIIFYQIKQGRGSEPSVWSDVTWLQAMENNLETLRDRHFKVHAQMINFKP